MAEEFFRRIKDRRTAKGITQKQLAEAVGIAAGSLAAYEQGTKTPAVDVAAKIAKALDVSIDWLFGLEERAEAPEPKSFGDVIRAFLSISKVFPEVELSRELVDWKTVPVEETEAQIYLDEERITGETSYISVAVLKLWNFPIACFFEAWAKLHKLYLDGDIDADMYTAWLDKKLAEFEQMPIQKSQITKSQL